jgi:peptide/nickel transport system substrate-binding protein
MRAHRMAVFGCTALLAISAAACGGSSSDDDTGSGDTAPPPTEETAGIADTIVMGTTDTVVALDPAGAYAPARSS